MASVIIAIDPMRRDNGCLQLLRGSHRLGRVTHVPVRGHEMVKKAGLAP